MRAFAVDQFGEAGSVHELPDPSPSEGQVRVRVQAAGLNPADLSMMGGQYRDVMEHHLPLIPGLDVSGVVDQVGPGVSEFREGDRVFGTHGKMVVGEGSVAELVSANAAALAGRPDGIDTEFGGTLPLAGVSALQVTEAAGLKAGDVVLVLGAAGGIGGFVIQLAAASGARPIAVTRAVNHDYARGLGAAETIDYETQDVFDMVRTAHPTGVTAIIDLVGDKEANNRLAELLPVGGAVVSMRGGADADALGARGLRAVNLMTQVNRQRLEHLGELVNQGALRRPEIATFGLDKAAEAYALLETRHLRGKLVVVPNR